MVRPVGAALTPTGSVYWRGRARLSAALCSIPAQEPLGKALSQLDQAAAAFAAVGARAALRRCSYWLARVAMGLGDGARCQAALTQFRSLS